MSDELQITFARGTDVGVVRDHNEDWVMIEDPSDPAMQRKGRLFIVADGMGGYQAGEVASQLAGETVRREYYADPSADTTARLRNAVQAANGAVYRSAQGSTSHAGMGTTMVVTALMDNKAYIASVGDSRAYVVHQGVLSQITQDHSFVGEQIRAGILTKEQARVHPQRNVITRALGSQSTVQVDTFVGELLEGDVLVMCTDGLTSHVPDDRILDVVTQLPPDQAVAQLIQMAKDDGGTDNITTIVLRVGPPLYDGAITAPVARPQGETTTVAMPQPQANATLAQSAVAPAWTLQAKSAESRKRKSGGSMIWFVVGVLIALMAVGAAGVLVLSMSGLLRGVWGNVTPTATATTALPQVLPTVTPVEATATATLLPPTSTIAPTSTFTPTPTHTPTHTPRPLLPTLPLGGTPSPSASPSVAPTSSEGGTPATTVTPSPTAKP
jgi:serine/threonine protein phosphatase PrpC